jgi:membrane protein
VPLSDYRPAKLWKVTKAAASSYMGHEPLTLGAALSYYTVFSIAPILLIVISVAGLAFGAEAVRGEVSAQLGGILGAEGAKQIEQMIESAYRPGEGLFATVMAGVLLILGATAVFGEVRNSLDFVWDIKPKPRRGYLKHVIDRLVSFGMVAVLGFLLLVTLVVDAALTGATGRLERFLPQAAILLAGVLEFAFSFVVTVVLFAFVYKFLSDARLRWRDVWAGALMTAVLFLLGKFAIGLYLGRKDVGELYGVAGSVLLLLMWVYYSSQTLFFGAELTRAFAEERGSKIAPSDQAVTTKTVEIETSGRGHAPRPRPA